MLSMLKLDSNGMKSGPLNAAILEVPLQNTCNEYHMIKFKIHFMPDRR